MRKQLRLRLWASWGAAAVLALAACAPARPTDPPKPKIFTGGAPGVDSVPRLKTAFARKIKDERDLVGGPMATGRMGDYVLGNYRVRFIVSDIEHAGGFTLSGGHVIDADLAAGGRDALNEVWAYLDDTFPRQPLYSNLEVTAPGAGGYAEITVKGADSQAPALSVTTRYRLLPDADYLIIQTSIRNDGAEIVRDYELGDAVQWGMAEYYGPGVGRSLRGARDLGLPWLAGTARGVSYGWTAAGERLNGPHGGGWSDPIVRSVTIQPGQSETYTRYLIVGDGDVASVLGSAFALAGDPVGVVNGEVVDPSGEPVVDARVQIDHSDSTPYAWAHVDSSGRYSIPLPKGIYEVSFSAAGRAPLEETQEVGVGNGRLIRMDGRLSERSQLVVEATESGRAIPVKVTVQGTAGTPDPVFGPTFRAQGAGNTAYAYEGKTTLPLAPGQYQVTVSRGIEYSTFTQKATVKEGETTTVRARIKRELDTRGWYAADFHQHSRFSPDSAALPEDIVIANLCEGMEMIAGTDHDVIPDYTEALARLHAGDTFKVIPGDEITTRSWGHFNLFPLKRDAGKADGGAFDHKDRKPADFLPEVRKLEPNAVLQLNHPRAAGKIGFYNVVELDFQTGRPDKPDGFSLEYDAIEVFNGKRVADAERVLADWYMLLNQGHAFTATGNSDSHSLFGQERGYPRTYVPSDAAEPGRVETDEVVDALRNKHQAVVTNGPFVEMWANNLPIGSTIKSQPGAKVRVRVKVQAAPWVGLDKLELVQDGKVVQTVSLEGKKGTVRYDGTLTVTAARDSWIHAIVRGSEGLQPVLPPDRGEAVTPLGLTNPIWIDTDGNGKFDAASKEQSATDPGEKEE